MLPNRHAGVVRMEFHRGLLGIVPSITLRLSSRLTCSCLTKYGPDQYIKSKSDSLSNKEKCYNLVEVLLETSTLLLLNNNTAQNIYIYIFYRVFMMGWKAVSVRELAQSREVVVVIKSLVLPVQCGIPSKKLRSHLGDCRFRMTSWNILKALFGY